MNPSLAKFMLAETPTSVLDPTPGMNSPTPLNTGNNIPALGFGTRQLRKGEAKKAAYHALKSGYRYIDCAPSHENEDEVGEAIADALKDGIAKRPDLFIAGRFCGAFCQHVEQELDKSLKSLGVGYLDLYLMDRPCPADEEKEEQSDALPSERPVDSSRGPDGGQSHRQAWKLMETLPATGKVRAIGVANHDRPRLKELLQSAEIVPAVNQVESHPLLPQQDVSDLCSENGIHVTAYGPFGSTGGPLLGDEDVKAVAAKHGVGPATVLLSWQVARGNSVLARSVTPSRIEGNRKIIKLDAEDMQTLYQVHKKRGLTRYVSPPSGASQE